ncbi:MAG: ABC transporter permease [Candidatus Planktophila sp.]|nr:ABC transporter permease [Candidatus Planktophila sp.]
MSKKVRKVRPVGTLGIYIGSGMMAAMLLAGLLIPLFGKYDANEISADQIMPPSRDHLFGTDMLGRDIFARVFDAVFIDIGTAFAGVLIPLAVGTIIGTLLGISRNRKFNSFIGSLIDGINAFPFLIFVIALVAFLGAGLGSIILALSLVNWARYARIARTRAVVVNQQGYVEAARTLGYKPTRILFRHIIPNVSSETRAYALSDFIIVIIAVAALSFLGLGVNPPQAEWGAMIKDGANIITLAWWSAVFPGLAICWAGISVAVFSEGLSARIGEGNQR